MYKSVLSVFFVNKSLTYVEINQVKLVHFLQLIYELQRFAQQEVQSTAFKKDSYIWICQWHMGRSHKYGFNYSVLKKYPCIYPNQLYIPFGNLCISAKYSVSTFN